MTTVLLLGHGLSPTLTGIERLLVEHATWLLGQGHDVRVTADADATWPEALPQASEVIPLRRKVAQLLRQVPDAAHRDAGLVHSFGPTLPRGRAATVYSVYDWGPLRDPTIPLRGRVVWSCAMFQGIRRADVLHAISTTTLAARPRWAKGVWRVTTPSGLAAQRQVDPATRDSFVLYVGTDSPRKRTGELVAAVELAPELRLVLVGAGTEHYGAADSTARVRGIGAVDDEELGAWYDACRVLALVSSYEGFGIPVREALERGIPVVVSAAVAACHPEADPDLVVVVPEPPSPEDLSKALLEGLRRPVKPAAATTGPGPEQLYATLL
ncbi:MAG: hypothetical protein JWP14_318 [Frankiales bacterium]|nr:hypothetical protein [Frankiales bacterium]